VFTISTGAASARLLRLLAVPDFADASFRVQQFAVWTITDYRALRLPPVPSWPTGCAVPSGRSG